MTFNEFEHEVKKLSKPDEYKRHHWMLQKTNSEKWEDILNELPLAENLISVLFARLGDSDKVTFDQLKIQMEPFKNTLVLDPFSGVVRLVDVIYGEDDFYWVYDTYKGEIHSSCVGSWIPLKGFIPDDDYTRLLLGWNGSNSVKAI